MKKLFASLVALLAMAPVVANAATYTKGDYINFAGNDEEWAGFQNAPSQYFLDQNAKHNYKLIGVVSYIINDLQNWFLISHCLSPIDNKWYTYKDSTVNEVYDFKSQILNHGLPCILFYQKIE